MADIQGGIVVVEDSLNPDESPVYQNRHCVLENGGRLISTFRALPECKTTIQLLRSATLKFKDLPFVGSRVKLGDSLGEYHWKTYQEFLILVESFASGLHSLGITRGDKVGIYSHNCIEWQIACFAIQMLSAVPVPVYDSLGPNAAQHIVAHSECKGIIVNEVKYDKFLNFKLQTPLIQFVIVIGQSKSGEKSFTDFFNRPPLDSYDEPSPEDTAIIMYTSGSTGSPKGCVLLHRNLIAAAAGFSCLGTSATKNDIFLSFLPLAHIYEMTCELIALSVGMRIGYFSGSIINLLDDIKELRPTAICSVPRVLNKLVSEMKKKLDTKPYLIRKLFELLIYMKIHNNNSFLIDLFFKPFKDALGGRIRFIVSSGAPLLKDVFEFFRAVISPAIIQGMGMTECAGGICVQELPDHDPNSIGFPVICAEIKLKKVSDLPYDPRGIPPQGEIFVRGPHVFKEYFKDPERTVQSFEGEWLITGDIAEINESGTFRVIDRAKQLVKLSQGEFVSLTNMIDYYNTAEGVNNVFVYGDGFHDSLVAIVVPNQALLSRWTGDINSTEHQQEILQSFSNVHKKYSLRGFERISKVYIEQEDFTITNGLLTPSMKPALPGLKKKYGSILEDLLGQN